MGNPETSERVLIVDDEQALANVMARALRSRGIEADTAFSGKQARRLFDAQDYALVLLDVRLPDESGYGLLQTLRERRPETAVVIVSGVDDPELGRAALEHGAYGYVIKPIGSTQIYLLAVNNLRRRALERQHRAAVERLEAMVAERADQSARAAELQKGMLPQSPLLGQGFELAARLAPAQEISGDFYDWWRGRDGRIVIVVGDVMGKGLAAALVMATARAALRGAASAPSLGEGMAQAAGVMAAALAVNQAYVTVFECEFDPATGALEYVDAGHGHARIVRGGSTQDLLEERSAPIGLLPDAPFKVGQATLRGGDTLVVFSDGLLDLQPDVATRDVLLPLEARNAVTAQGVVDALLQPAHRTQPLDDVTALALKRT